MRQTHRRITRIMERIRGTMKALIAPVPRWREAQTASTRIQRQLHGGSGFTRVLQRYRRDTSRLINAALGDGRRAMNAAMRDVHAWLSQEATVMTHYSTRLDTAEDDMVRRVGDVGRDTVRPSLALAAGRNDARCQRTAQHDACAD